jgi:adenosylcobinamide-phosphate synthase
VAAALGLRLGGTNRYGDRIEVRPVLGNGRLPEVGDIARAVQLCRQVTVALVTVLLAVEPICVLARRLATAHPPALGPGATKWT